MVIQTLKILLESSGYGVETRMHASEAIRYVEHKGRPDILISDMVMPEMTGTELAQKLRAHHPELAVLLMSGYTDDVVLSSMLESENTSFIQKPFSAEGMNQAIQDLLPSKANS